MTSDDILAYLDAHGVDGDPLHPGWHVGESADGAIGFCDETTLSWLSRASQPLRRLPLGLAATRDALTGQIGRRGLTGLFDAAGAAR